MRPYPIRLLVEDDLRRSRLTVFFRALLSLPHLIWWSLWSVAAVVVVVIQWFVLLIRGRPAEGLHGFLASFTRYTIRLTAYFFLVANPFPPFTPSAGPYPVDVEIDPPAQQNRWTVGFRMFLAVPAFSLAGALAGWGVSGGYYSLYSVLGMVAFLGWFAALARARMPQGMRDLGSYGLSYLAQATGYVLLLTDRYPDSKPELTPVQPAPEHPVVLNVADDLRRSRLTVFFRALLFLPHYVWLLLWTIAVELVAIVNWVATLIRGVPPQALQRFLSAYVRYTVHVYSFLYLAANPFPGFTGAPGTYPVEVELPGPQRQHRATVGFRLLLAFPAAILSSVLGFAALTCMFFGWFAALFTGRMPEGFRNLLVYYMRYNAQVIAYGLLITGRYPYSGSVHGRAPESEHLAQPSLAPEPAA
jgi:hypothetical protein